MSFKDIFQALHIQFYLYPIEQNLLTEALLAEEKMRNESLPWTVICPDQDWPHNWQGLVQKENVGFLVQKY